MSNPLGDQADAEAALLSRARRSSLSTSAHERLKTALLADSYLFTKTICKHKDLVPAIHMPVSYLACGLTDRLIETLDIPALDSYVTRKLRQDLQSRFRQFGTAPWRTREGRDAIDLLINGSLMQPAVVNIRMSRRFFKSSVVTHGGTLFMATVDPDRTIKITHNVDPKAWAFCEQIARTILSGTYIDMFPERIPEGDLSKLIGQKRITLGGRTISHPQKTIEAGGYDSTDESAHYDIFVTDDGITDQTPISEIADFIKYMKRMTGFYMPTRPIRRLEVGTKHDEEDDDHFLTTGLMAEQCFTLRVPIEEYEGAITNIEERGKPTCPELFPSERITKEQAHVLSGAEDEDGYRTWFTQYLLSATGGTLRLFPPDVVDDPDRWWLGPYDHPELRWRKQGRFLIARFDRKNGKPVAKPNRTILGEDGGLLSDWRENAMVLSYDPWLELDRAMLIDPAWSEREFTDNWGVSCVGQDPDNVRFQLETLSEISGIEGWIAAAAYIDEKWHPRAIGFDGNAMQDPMIQNLMRTDKRLRRMASRMVKVPNSHMSKAIRLQEGVAEPLKIYRYLLAPAVRNLAGVDAFGGNITRQELKLIKSTPKHSVRTDQDGIADTLAMAGSVLRASRKRDDLPPFVPRAKYDPILGVPLQ